MKISPVDVKPQVPEYYTWMKGHVVQLSKHFASDEFDCHCKFPECSSQRISSDLLSRLEKLREEAGLALHVTSGYRCTRYQKVLTESGIQTAKNKSQHELGNAADIAPDNGDIAKTLDIANRMFDSIGTANSFIHLDTRPKKVDGTQRRWKY